MKIYSDIKINGKNYPKGFDLPWYKIYPFFLLHMLMFGLSGFFISYAQTKAPISGMTFAYMHGGIAIFVYTIFYLTIFGKDSVKWMVINSILGMFGIYSQLGFILGLFGKHIGDYYRYQHITPFCYYVLYTFLLRNFLIDLTGCRDDELKQKTINTSYVIGSLIIYGLSYFVGKF